ncbi:hypothetical protein [Paenibacillus durus]|nr:hypothetical protein [Paenibacillus durus]
MTISTVDYEQLKILPFEIRLHFASMGGKIRLLTNGMDPAPPEFSER